MKLFKMIFYVAIILLGLLFTGLFFVQLFDTITDPTDFLFFQIVMVFVWFCGALVFDILGLVLIKQMKRERNEIRERD